MQTTPSYHMEGLPMAQVAILKIFDQVRKDLDCELFYSELRAFWKILIIFTILATDNIHIVLENDNTINKKDLKGCKC